jgi:hypothetical protein
MLPASIRRDQMPLNRVTVLIASIFAGLSIAFAQPEVRGAVAPAATTTCNNNTRGSAACPNYTAPAATALPSTSMDGSMVVPTATSTTLFGGKVPPNAFMVQATSYNCFVNDNGPANGQNAAPQAGFWLLQGGGPGGVTTFMTPPGYKPIGPVSVYCDGPAYVAARGW